MAERVPWGLTELADASMRQAGVRARIAGIMAAARLEVAQAQFTTSHSTGASVGAAVVSYRGDQWTVSDGTIFRPISGGTL